MCKLLAVLLSPGMLLLLIVGTQPEGLRWSLPIAVAAYALAHLLFWPPLFATRFLVGRFRIQSVVWISSVLGVVSAVIWLPAAILVRRPNQDPGYWLREIVRDMVSLGVAKASAFVLYFQKLLDDRGQTLYGCLR